MIFDIFIFDFHLTGPAGPASRASPAGPGSPAGPASPAGGHGEGGGMAAAEEKRIIIIFILKIQTSPLVNHEGKSWGILEIWTFSLVIREGKYLQIWDLMISVWNTVIRILLNLRNAMERTDIGLKKQLILFLFWKNVMIHLESMWLS